MCERRAGGDGVTATGLRALVHPMDPTSFRPKRPPCSSPGSSPRRSCPVLQRCNAPQSWTRSRPIPSRSPWTRATHCTQRTASLTHIADCQGGGYPRALLLVRFRPGATAAERSAAISLSRGQLIGGDGGSYWIVVEDDGTADPLWRAIDRLCVLPQVVHAGPEIISLNLTNGTIMQRVREGSSSAPAGPPPLPAPDGPPRPGAAADTLRPLIVDTIPPDTFTISHDSLEVLYSPAHLTGFRGSTSGRYPRALLLVNFHRDATVAERVAAIELSEGRLIGGNGLFYYIVVEDDERGDPLWRAIDRLSVLSQVRYAGPDPSLNLTNGAPPVPAGAAPPPRPSPTRRSRPPARRPAGRRRARRSTRAARG